MSKKFFKERPWYEENPLWTIVGLTVFIGSILLYVAMFVAAYLTGSL
jgi:hypothetical protein